MFEIYSSEGSLEFAGYNVIDFTLSGIVVSASSTRFERIENCIGSASSGTGRSESPEFFSDGKVSKHV